MMTQIEENLNVSRIYQPVVSTRHKHSYICNVFTYLHIGIKF